MATDVVSPLIDVLVVPARVLAGVYDYFRELKKIHEDNSRLRDENRRLVMMSSHARALEIENKLLSNLLNYTPPPEATFYYRAGDCRRGECFFAFSDCVYRGQSPG